MKWFLLWVALGGAQIISVATFADGGECRVMAKVMQEKSPEAARGRFQCVRLWT